MSSHSALLQDSYNPLWSLQELKAETLSTEMKAARGYQNVSYEAAERKSYPAFVPVSPRQQVHECLDCGKKYKWLDSLRRHQRVECGNKTRKFACNYCDKKYKYRYEMRNHIMSHHNVSMTESVNDASLGEGDASAYLELHTHSHSHI